MLIIIIMGPKGSDQSCEILLDNSSKTLTLHHYTYHLVWRTLFNIGPCKWYCNHWMETIEGVTGHEVVAPSNSLVICHLDAFSYSCPRAQVMTVWEHSNILPLLCSYTKIRLWVVITLDVRKQSTMWSIYGQSLENPMLLYNYTQHLVSPKQFVIDPHKRSCKWEPVTLSTPFKVDGSWAACFLNQTPWLDWYLVRRGSKIKHHQDTCL